MLPQPSTSPAGPAAAPFPEACFLAPLASAAPLPLSTLSPSAASALLAACCRGAQAALPPGTVAPLLEWMCTAPPLEVHACAGRVLVKSVMFTGVSGPVRQMKPQHTSLPASVTTQFPQCAVLRRPAKGCWPVKGLRTICAAVCERRSAATARRRHTWRIKGQGRAGAGYGQASSLLPV